MERSLVQILVPQVNGHGDRVPPATLQALGRELTDRFGGVTCYSRAPAEGLWQQDEDAPPKKDDIIIYEVMAQRFDRPYWRALQERLEIDLAQREIVIRAQLIEVL
jgi:hypothetical protein